jgi:hypothetical protein
MAVIALLYAALKQKPDDEVLVVENNREQRDEYLGRR